MHHAIEKALRVASRQVDRDPSDAQIRSGNYSKGHLTYKGLNIAIENPKGSERSGIDKGGKRWAVKMPSSYGYIKGTEGKDGDHVDCYIGPDHNSDKVWIIDQVDADTGRFDEHKTFLSYDSKDAVLKDYHKAFSDGRANDRIGGIKELSLEDFKRWLKHSDTTKPIAKSFAFGGVVSHGDDGMPLLPGKSNIGHNIATERENGRKLSQAVAIALNVARRGKAGGGEVEDTPALGPLGSGLTAEMLSSPKSTALALAHLARARSFPDLVAENPHGWGRELPAESMNTVSGLREPGIGSPDAAIVRAALAAGEFPARMYADQFGNATDATAAAMRDPSLANLTNAGVQSGLALGSPALTAGSGALGFGTAALEDLMPSVVPEAEARSRRRPSVQPYRAPTPVQPAAPEVDPLAEKYKDDPTISLLLQQINAARVDATRDYPGRNGDQSRAQAAQRVRDLQGKLGAELAARDKAKRDAAQGQYDQQVSNAIDARDKNLSRMKRFSDTEVGKVYDTMGGAAPFVAGMAGGLFSRAGSGPIKSIWDGAKRLGETALLGVGANNLPLAYNAFATDPDNPERKAYEDYAYFLPDGHPDKAKAQARAESLPRANPIRTEAAEELYDPRKFAERALMGAGEAVGGFGLGYTALPAIGGSVREVARGFVPSRPPNPGSMSGAAAMPEPVLPIGPASTRPLLSESLPPTSAELSTRPLPDQNLLGIAPPATDPRVSAALNATKRQVAAPSSSPVFSPDDLSSDKASKIIKSLTDHNVNVWDHGGRQVPRRGPGTPEGGQIISQDEFQALTKKASKAKGKAKASPSSDVQVDPNTNIPIKPAKDFDPDDPINRGSATGGVIKGVLNLARKYAQGGKVAVGPIVGTTGGRADAKDVEVPSGAWVWPADVVAGRGQGNTNAGQEFLANLERAAVAKMGGRIMPPAHRAAGGATGSVPIRIADGERVSPPDVVWAFGGGDLDHGHRVLDHLTKRFRAEDIHTLSNLPGPSR